MNSFVLSQRKGPLKIEERVKKNQCRWCRCSTNFFWGFHIEKIKMDIYVHRFELKAKKAKRSRLATSNCEFVFN